MQRREQQKKQTTHKKQKNTWLKKHEHSKIIIETLLFSKRNPTRIRTNLAVANWQYHMAPGSRCRTLIA
jgi:hypothetical protein